MNVANERKHGSCEDIYYVIEGEALVTIGEAEQTLRAGDIIMLDGLSQSSRRSGC